MALDTLRREVLRSFKSLHRVRCVIFQDDNMALTAARQRINEEYRKSKHVTDVDSIRELIKYANEVETELRTTVVQLREVKPGVMRVMMRPDIQKNDNVLYVEEKEGNT